MFIKNTLTATLVLLSSVASANAADYVIDDKGSHASVNFKVKHLGYSWLTGRFNTFSGTFSYDDENITASKVNININTASIDSNHAERDKHLKSDDFLDVNTFKSATFESSSVVDKGNGEFVITGNFTLQGITKEIQINAYKVGEGDDPWGGYRAGFSGSTSIFMKDFGYKMDFGEIIFDLHLEGIKQ